MLKKEEYLKAVRRPYPPLFFSLVMEGSNDTLSYKGILADPFVITQVIVDTLGNVYYSKEEMIKSGELIFKELDNKNKLEIFENILSKKEKVLIESTEKDFVIFCEAYKAYMPALILVWKLEEPMLNKIKSLFLEKISAIEADKLLGILNVSLQDNFYRQEEYDLLKSKDLCAHAKKYEFLNSRYGEKNPYTQKQAKEKLSKINKLDFLKKWKQDKLEIEDAIDKAKKILSKDDRYFIDMMQFIIYYRTQRTDIMNKAAYLFIPKLDKLAKKKNLTYRQIIHCTKGEILNKLPNTNIINERIKENAIILDDGKITCLHGKKAIAIDNFLEEDIGDVCDLKGVIARKGLVSGKVRLIHNQNDLNKIEEGDVLITSMTTPDMLGAMKKASAFVTDEGGITCHAAILARELKKTCLIGTKVATQVFKDGDMVEVDAIQGIVRKIK